jgi:predicted alpha-1,2-mannosidase
VLALGLGCQQPPEPQSPIEPYDPLPLVDPFIGTGGFGAEVIGLNPGAALPFGMTQVGPDTRDSVTGAPPFYHFGGYHYGDDLITGFSHEHANGMGVNDFGGILIMPRLGWDAAFAEDTGRAAAFSHEEESASPGLYSVRLADDGTEVEIVATRHGGMHRYRFATGSSDLQPTVLLDLGHELGTVNIGDAAVEVDLASAQIDAYQLLQGSYSSRFGGLKTWARLSFEPAPLASGTWSEAAGTSEGSTAATGAEIGAWLTFPAGTEEVLVRVALSHVDAQGAQGNHSAQLQGRSFDELRDAAEAAWREELGYVRVRGGSDEQRTIFHTALYHTALWPNVFADSDGRYRGMDGEVHESDFLYHSNFSMWDTFRTTHPWMTLSRPDKAREFAQSLVRMYEDGGSMPRWALGHGYTGGMVGTPAAQILAGTWLKGVTGWDAETGFEACFLHSTTAMPDASRAAIDEYQGLHYVPMEASGGSTSLGLEYAWNDHALSLWAQSLGHAEEAAVMAEQSTWWRNNWDPAQEFMVGRYSDGSFHEIGNPDTWHGEYVEGDSWHYLWPAPYDAQGMVDLQHGGDLDAFLARLDLYWNRVESEEDDSFPDTYYWHGNEPDLHHPWLGSLLDRPNLSVQPVRHVMATRYGTGPDGLDGNDDAGTLSSWYLFAALGLYPVAGTPDYAVASPIFERVELDRPGTTLVLSAPDLPLDAPVPSSVQAGGEDLVGWTVSHQQLVEAGGLLFGFEG